jgi:predicted methyltransferase
MSEYPESSSGSFAFRLATFLILFSIAVAGFSSLIWQKLYGETQTNPNVNAAIEASPSPTILQPTDNINRPASEPYVGDLSIFEDPKRDENLQINRVMDILGIKQGSSVADIGAGSGWFSVRAARRVGVKGIVYANEINQDYLNYISNRAKKENLSNIKTVSGKEDDPGLPENSIDAVMILKTYHEIQQPVRLLKNLQKSLRSNARLGIIDRNGKGDDHGLDQEVIVKEAAQAGFKLIESYDFVKPDGMDFFLVFQAR